MKSVLLFAVFAVMAYGVFSKNLFDDIPRDIELPALTTPKTRRTGAGRIVGGAQVNQNDRKLFKHQVWLEFDKNLCGGSIISERSIITAAHCTENNTFGTAFIGLYDTSRTDSANQSIKFTKKDWVNHPDYVQNKTVVINDLAIINLPEPIKFGEFAGPIEVECDDRQRHENEKVIISGWGRTTSDQSRPTEILRTATVQTAPDHVCKMVYGSWLLPSMICVPATNTVGTCEGDSGGPLVSTINNKLLGVTSFGAKSPRCENDYPRIFTRLSSFAKWIQDNTPDHIKNC